MKLKPILMPHNEVTTIITMYHDGKMNHCELSTDTHKLQYHTNQHIILVDPKAEIVEGDLFYNTKSGALGTSNGVKIIEFKDDSKIIASTNKSHVVDLGHLCLDTIPQLSPQSIQLLINYYNKYKCMPESIDAEEYESNAFYRNGVKIRKTKMIKRNQHGEVDITIPEVEDNIQKDILHICQWYQGKDVECCERVEKLAEEKLYTKKDLEEAWNDGSQLKDLGHLTFKEWFNSKKK